MPWNKLSSTKTIYNIIIKITQYVSKQFKTPATVETIRQENLCVVDYLP